VAEYSLNLGHRIQLHKTSIFSTKPRYLRLSFILVM
jgi:hypothetical protein